MFHLDADSKATLATSDKSRETFRNESFTTIGKCNVMCFNKIRFP